MYRATLLKLTPTLTPFFSTALTHLKKNLARFLRIFLIHGQILHIFQNSHDGKQKMIFSNVTPNI